LLSAKKVGANNNFQFSDSLAKRTAYGLGVCSLGDLNNDGNTDIAVSAFDFDNNEGVIYVLFLDSKQEVISYVEIGRNKGGLVPNSALSFSDFGISMDALGDFNKDGTVDLLVGNRNEVYLLFLNTNGTVKSHKRIASGNNGLNLSIDARDYFGYSVGNVGDINGDGVVDIGVYNPDDRSVGGRSAFLYILFLNQDGSVKRYHRIDTRNNILKDTVVLANSRFGTSVCRFSKNRIIVGSSTATVNAERTGLIWLLDLDTNGVVTDFKRISNQTHGFTDTLHDLCLFGTSVDNIGDIDGDSIDEIAIGASFYFDSLKSGAVFILSLNRNDSINYLNRISNSTVPLPYVIHEEVRFGNDIAGVGDLNGDGKYDLITAGPRERISYPTGPYKGRIHVLYLDGISHKDNTVNTDNTPQLISINTLSIYPNPTNSTFKVSGTQDIEIEGVLVVLDMTGKVIYTLKNHNSKTAVDSKHLVSGMYIINYQTEKGFYQGKLIKE